MPDQRRACRAAQRQRGRQMVQVAVRHQHRGERAQRRGGPQDGLDVPRLVWPRVDRGQAALAVADQVRVGTGQRHWPGIRGDHPLDHLDQSTGS
jgi:hypothetical protein